MNIQNSRGKNIATATRKYSIKSLNEKYNTPNGPKICKAYAKNISQPK